MRHPAAYEELLSEFLRAKVALFGPVAVRKAAEVHGLRLAACGAVLGVEGDGYDVLDAVLRAFERLSGRASSVSARSSVRRLKLHERFPELELPQSLR
jgi:hypothetical protein